MKRGFVGGAVALIVAVVVAVSGTPTNAATDNPGSGYWMLGVDGNVYAFGTSPHCGNARPAMFLDDFAVDIEPFPDGTGY